MESLDLHPEDLFDKAARGTATPDDLSRIEAHLAACATCRFERQVRADFDAIGGSAADLDDLVARALSGAKASQEPAVDGPRRRRFGGVLVAAVAMMGFASFAAVAQYTGVLPRLITQLTETPAREPEPAPPAPRAVRRATTPAVVAERVAPPSSPAPEVVVPPPAPVVASEEKTAPAPRVVRPAPAARARPEVVKETPPAPLDVTPEIPRAPEPAPIDLFVRAHYARVHGETATAIRDFRTVVARFPDAPEAALAHAELGQLLLARGEPASALESFDAYLSSHDTSVREEIRGARALALQALNRPAEERAAWEALLRDYPEGVYAPRAKARLEALAP
ncbi:MAG: tetratricopeptide repeat protein [Myxococcota bacterium]